MKLDQWKCTLAANGIPFEVPACYNPHVTPIVQLRPTLKILTLSLEGLICLTFSDTPVALSKMLYSPID